MRASPEPFPAPDYPLHAGEPLLRLLGATEWNMERLNRMSNGAGNVYQVLRTRGPLDIHALAAALRVLQARHPLLRSRVVRTGEAPAAPLAFVDALDAGPLPLRRVHVKDPARDWPAVVERDMAAGPAPTWRGPMFWAALLEQPDAVAVAERVVLLAGPHSCADGASLAALSHELLSVLAGEGTGSPPATLALAGLETPFVLATPEHVVAEHTALSASMRAWEQAAASARRRDLEGLTRRVSELESQLREAARDAQRPAALLEVSAWLDALEGWDSAQAGVAGVAPEQGVPAGADRANHVRTGLRVGELNPAIGTDPTRCRSCALGLPIRRSCGLPPWGAP